MKFVTESLIITYSRSSGPGGQHVNTVNTKVDLRVHLESASWLHPDIRARILEKVGLSSHNIFNNLSVI